MARLARQIDNLRQAIVPAFNQRVVEDPETKPATWSGEVVEIKLRSQRNEWSFFVPEHSKSRLIGALRQWLADHLEDNGVQFLR